MKQIHHSQQASPVQLRITEAITQPLLTLRGLAFQVFLAKHGLSLHDVALAAGVRLLTVWSLTRGLPIARQQAQRVRAGLCRLTGTVYRGGITLRLEPTHARPQKQHMDHQEG
jgi:hypothetical protein